VDRTIHPGRLRDAVASNSLQLSSSAMQGSVQLIVRMEPMRRSERVLDEGRQGAQK
jgi:hypothetical protein